MRASRSRMGQCGTAILIACISGSAFAGPFGLNEQITNFTFDDPVVYPINAQPVQTGPGPTDSYPQDVVYHVQVDTGGSTRVNNAGTMTKAVVMTTVDAGIGEHYV